MCPQLLPRGARTLRHFNEDYVVFIVIPLVLV